MYEKGNSGMFECFYPHHYIKSAYVIPFDQLYDQGFRGIIFDIDNTLVEHGAPADKRSLALFSRLHGMGYRTVLLSNNKEPRVRSFNDAVGARYIFRAGKPSVKNYIRAMEMMGTDRHTTVFVGDQLFTDVWGARRAGLHTWLVQPIDKKEEIQIILKRYPERMVLSSYKRRCEKENRIFLEEGQ
jgi:HAD superfamily phosphatase (TIGR01668 family)